MKKALAILVLTAACSSDSPPPVQTTPEPEPATSTPGDHAIGTVRVTAASLNVRRDPSASSEVVTQVRKGTRLTLLTSGDGWMKVRLDDGSTGWVASQHVSREGTQARRSRRGCAPDSDYRFVKAPVPSFSQGGPHGVVTIEANVTRDGVVTSTRVISNTTGDPNLAAMAEREIRAAKFAAPVRDCTTREFIFTYKRSF